MKSKSGRAASMAARNDLSRSMKEEISSRRVRRPSLKNLRRGRERGDDSGGKLQDVQRRKKAQHSAYNEQERRTAKGRRVRRLRGEMWEIIGRQRRKKTHEDARTELMHP